MAAPPLPYPVEKLPGQGGQGTVWRVRDPLTGRTMAAKVLTTEKTELRRRFLREMTIGVNFEHPHILPVYQTGQLPTREPYMILKEV